MTDPNSATADEAPAESIFDAQAPTWNRVSPKYVVVDFIGNIVPIVVALAVWIIISASTGNSMFSGLWWIYVVVIGLFALNAAFGVRRTRAIGYQLRRDDLLFRRGIMFERIVAVPYGRMQLVDTKRGPVLRALGLASLNFVTAAIATNVVLPGLTYDEAVRLRDELVELAESRRSGL